MKEVPLFDIRRELTAQRRNANERIKALLRHRHQAEQSIEQIAVKLAELDVSIETTEQQHVRQRRRLRRQIMARDTSWKQSLRRGDDVSPYSNMRELQIKQRRSDRRIAQHLSRLVEERSCQHATLQQERADLMRRIKLIDQFIGEHERRIATINQRERRAELEILKQLQIPEQYQNEGSYDLKTSFAVYDHVVLRQYEVSLAADDGDPYGDGHGHVVGVIESDNSLRVSYSRPPNTPHGAHNYIPRIRGSRS